MPWGRTGEFLDLVGLGERVERRAVALEPELVERQHRIRAAEPDNAADGHDRVCDQVAANDEAGNFADFLADSVDDVKIPLILREAVA